MKYPAGTRLRFARIPSGLPMRAKLGATATVVEDYDSANGPYVQVKWDRNEKADTQSNGGYSARNFDVISYDPRVSLDRKIAKLQKRRAAMDKIKVGDTVTTMKKNTATVISVANGRAWVKTKRGQNVIADLKDLKKND